MTTRVFLTIDTELVWRHHAAGLPVDEIVERSLEPAGVGIGYQLAQLNQHGLKACFFVDPFPALVYGAEPIRKVVGAILDAGQEVQLHLHPNWRGADSGEARNSAAAFELTSYSVAEQRQLIALASEQLVEAGAPRPIAFRAGSYAANDDTIDALVELGFAYDSSHNGSAHPWASAISLPPERIAPVMHHGIVEVPVTLIEDRAGKLRHFQICALSIGEMQSALAHAIRERHAAVTIVSHGFELANRAGTGANRIHVRRFEALCRMLDASRGALETSWFRDMPKLPLDRADTPLGPSRLRTGIRRAEQLWSNYVAERFA